MKQIMLTVAMVLLHSKMRDKWRKQSSNSNNLFSLDLISI